MPLQPAELVSEILATLADAQARNEADQTEMILDDVRLLPGDIPGLRMANRAAILHAYPTTATTWQIDGWVPDTGDTGLRTLALGVAEQALPATLRYTTEVRSRLLEQAARDGEQAAAQRAGFVVAHIIQLSHELSAAPIRAALDGLTRRTPGLEVHRHTGTRPLSGFTGTWHGYPFTFRYSYGTVVLEVAAPGSDAPLWRTETHHEDLAQTTETMTAFDVVRLFADAAGALIRAPFRYHYRATLEVPGYHPAATVDLPPFWADTRAEALAAHDVALSAAPAILAHQAGGFLSLTADQVAALPVDVTLCGQDTRVFPATEPPFTVHPA